MYTLMRLAAIVVIAGIAFALPYTLIEVFNWGAVAPLQLWQVMIMGLIQGLTFGVLGAGLDGVMPSEDDEVITK